MDSVRRVVVNTLAQHVKTITTVVLSLYSTRVILEALGQSDFGLFSLVGGVVVMLGFITNGMAVATQRHLSFFQGKGDQGHVTKVFQNSLLLHVCLGTALCLVLVSLTGIIFDHFLNIDPRRVEAGVVVYLLMVANLFISFIATPYRAAFIARENIVFVSLIDILDGVLRLGAAIVLAYYGGDRLILYGWIVTAVSVVNFIAFSLYANSCFPECRFTQVTLRFERKVVGELLSFTGWTVYSLGCLIARSQGLAVVLNHFFGTLINTAYGIAMQVSNSIQFIAQAIVNAMAPQIIKAEGEQNREKMLSYAEKASKYAYMLLLVVVVPLVMEMENVLRLWLGEVPDYAILMCDFLLITGLCDQTTIGLNTANQAVGNIRNFSIAVNTTKVLTLPLVAYVLAHGYEVFHAMCCYIGIECFCAVMRLFFLKYTAGLSIFHYIRHVVLPIFFPTLVVGTACMLVCASVEIPARFLLTGVVSVVAGVASLLIFGMNAAERTFVFDLLKKRANERTEKTI